MRICSFLPSATEMCYLLGAGDNVVGVTHECDFPPAAARQPVVIRSTVAHGEQASAEINRLVGEAMQRGGSLYTIDEPLLEHLQPDLILTQDLCNVCAIDAATVARVVSRLASRPQVLSLNPHTLDDVLQDVLRVGAVIGRSPQAVEAVAGLRRRLAAVQQLAALTTGRPRVVCLEWLEPLMGAGHWVPEMVRLAGGREMIGRDGQPSTRITWEQVVAAQPEVLVLMPCGFPISRAAQELELLTDRPGWSSLPAVATGRVYVVDAGSYYNRSGPRLVDGVEILAELLHPDVCRHLIPPGAVQSLEALTPAPVLSVTGGLS